MSFYIGSIRCTVHDITISSVLYPNRFHVQDMKIPRPTLATYIRGKKINSHSDNEWFKGFTKTLKLVIVLSWNIAQIEHV